MISIFLAFLLEGVICRAGFSFGLIPATEATYEAMSLCLLAVNCILMLPYISHRYAQYGRKIVNFLILSLLLKAALVLWDYYATSIFVLPNSHSDSESFHYWAAYFATYGGVKVENYAYVVGFIYKLFGIQRITAQYFNVLLSFLGIDIFERIMREAEISYSSRAKTLVLAALLPNYLIIASILIRECLISVILCWSLYVFIKWWKHGNDLRLIGAMLITLLACYFHSGAVAVTIGYAIAPIISKRGGLKERTLFISLRSVALAVVCVFVFNYLFSALSDSLLGRFGGLGMDTIEGYIDGHGMYYVSESSTSSHYAAGFGGLSGPLGLIVNSPIRMFYFLWVPMPWSMRGLNDVIAFFGSSLFYGGTVFWAFSRLKQRQVRHYPLMVCVLAICLVGCLVFAWGVESAGSALRHREKFCFVFLLLYACLNQSVEEEAEEMAQRRNRGRVPGRGIKWKTIY